ncbi:MAG TPA: ABC transporter permease subunit, partial [Aggregatilineales bacterium]|nr:ABC transporter permease subunit [Aggregatilineales bacterium]
LRCNWRQILWWGLGVGSLGLVVALIVPNADVLKDFSRVVQSMPPSMLDMFGGEDAASVATPAGFLNLIFFSYALLILGGYAVLAGLNITANEEESKILDVLLSLPVPRWRLVIEKFLAYAVIIVGIVLLTFVGLWVGLKATPALSVDEGRLLESTLNLLPGTLLMLAMTVLLTALVRRKNAAAAIATVVIVGSYFIDSIGRQATASVANALRFLSFYTYYDSAAVIRSGLNWGNVLVLVVVALVLMAGGTWLFQRRNIGL